MERRKNNDKLNFYFLIKIIKSRRRTKEKMLYDTRKERIDTTVLLERREEEYRNNVISLCAHTFKISTTLI